MGNLDRLARDFAREPPASKEDIESYERRLARDFPASYRERLHSALCRSPLELEAQFAQNNAI
jgi:hypothetical protein